MNKYSVSGVTVGLITGILFYFLFPYLLNSDFILGLLQNIFPDNLRLLNFLESDSAYLIGFILPVLLTCLGYLIGNKLYKKYGY